MIGNAIKFTFSGYILVNAKLLSKDRNRVIIEFSVEDSGIGISKENVNNLFEVFNQLDNSITRKFGGSGLGLSITENLVHLLGGEISVESEINKGSKFTFTVSCKYNENETDENRSLIEKDFSELSFKGNILLVDDDETNLLVGSKYLEKYGLSVDVAKNGVESIVMVNQNSYDMIFYGFTNAINGWIYSI